MLERMHAEAALKISRDMNKIKIKKKKKEKISGQSCLIP
jgi:hypothetical protein